MASFGPLMRKAVLDWVCGGGAPTRPSERWAALTDTNGNEFSVSGYTRLAASFDASTNNSCSMLSVQTFALTASSALWVGSVKFFDASSGGNELFGGPLTPFTAKAGGAGVVVRDLGISLS